MTLRVGLLGRWLGLLALCSVAALWVGRGTGVARAGGSAQPTFVQLASAHSSSVSSLAVTPSSNVTAGNRLVVEVGVWSNASTTASTVTDSAGNSYVELLHFKASDDTEMSIWTAPVTAGGGTRPAITVKPSGKADVGAVALEYADVSTVSGTGVLDRSSSNTGTTGSAATVSSGATQPTTAANELAIGFYLDSGFGDTLAGGSGYTTRANVSPDENIELLAQDAIVGAGAVPNPTFSTGADTTWLTSTIVLHAGESGPATIPAAPSAVEATAQSGGATVSWTAPANGNSPITSYTVTPYIGSSAQTPTTVTGSPPASSTTISGLTNGTAYTFTVTATNSIGSGPASAASNSVTPSAAPGGEWAPLMSWPFEAIHMFLLSTGNVLAFDGWQQPEPTYVWNPTTRAFTESTAPDSIFCSGMAQLPDGEVMTVGGYGTLTTGNIGIVDTAVFNPATGTWKRVADMHTPRWYPDVTELADGDYVAISGNSTTATTWANTPEVYDPTANTWTALSKVSTSQVNEEEYPFSYLLPNGNVFTIGTSEGTSYELNVANQTWTATGGASAITNGSSVMYRPGKILYSGGAPSIANITNSVASTSTIDLTAATPKWQQIAPMHNNRIYHTLTMLADGTVLAIGGDSSSDQDVITTGVLPTEIWNPATETWSTAAPIAAARNYHSSAMLMPNGTVLVAGGGHPNGLSDPGQFSAQIYSPPYLFDGPRPAITSAPASSTYGSSITVSTPDASSIGSVNLVSLGADTHQSDMAQHFVPLSFTAGSGSLTVQTPANSALAPYGNYMLFIVNKQGVPSVSAPLNLSAAPSAPAAPTALSATATQGSATVSWTAPSPGTSPIISYTITPYIGTVAQTPTKITGAPPATSATITGLTNGATYTFTVTATNAVGSGPASAASSAVTPTATSAPAFVQQTSGHGHGTSLAVTPAANLTAGNRLVVEVGVWSSSNATSSSVKDAAGDTFTELLHFKASDGTEMSVWSAPVGAGAGAKPQITATPSSSADVGIAMLEYSGLSTAAGTAVVDQTAEASGTTKAAAVVTTPATAPTTGPNELVLGLYADSGFDDNLMARMGFNGRVNLSPTGDMELVGEDALTGATGATPSASVQSGASTIWLMATLVLKPAPAAEAPAAPNVVPQNLVAKAANGSAILSWTAPLNHGSQITTYTVTPYAGSKRLQPITVSGTSAAIGGLKNGRRYRFTVAARNALGKGPASRRTHAIRPSAKLLSAFWCSPFLMKMRRLSAPTNLAASSGEVWFQSGQETIGEEVAARLDSLRG
jgi:Domain of unknown function (DUF1929)/Fibronectin type III domain